MALCFNSSLSANGSTDVNLKNKRTGQTNRYTIYVYGDLGGGTVSVTLSPDNGNTFIANINNGAALDIAGDQVENLETNSDESSPVILRFTLAGATNPDVNIKVFNNG